MTACLQEDCANWDGDGCPCRVLDLEPVDVRCDPGCIHPPLDGMRDWERQILEESADE